MANNRLYIGNIETLEYIGIAKGYQEWDCDSLIVEFINHYDLPDSATLLVFFDESHEKEELYNNFMTGGTDVHDELIEIIAMEKETEQSRENSPEFQEWAKTYYREGQR